MVMINSSYSAARPVFSGNRTVSQVKFRANSDDVKNSDNNQTDSRNKISKTGEYFVAIQKSFYSSLKTAGKAFLQTAYYGDSDDLGAYAIWEL